MRRRTVAVLAAAAAALLGVGVGGAQGRSVSTAIVVDDSTATGTPLTVWGHLDSPRKKCLSGRTVKLFEDFANGSSKLVGRDRSSRNGVWVTQGDLTKLAVGEHVRVTSKRVGRPRHRRTCAGGSESFST
jgi:hypothetical protein